MQEMDSDEADNEDPASRMRRMFASRGTESLELFEARSCEMQAEIQSASDGCAVVVKVLSDAVMHILVIVHVNVFSWFQGSGSPGWRERPRVF